ncbi:hypothetical protein [Nereida sp. MMG025]|uniref:hypothetical protein n=1 Tax=Nereida sp. MMG025 TaxID=2909981 RepID=UPI001F381991|nr:hypothetical protein [Nereida sp. MMG025]MCF6443416.1 hypothetical protein [Nereida sp. MMG025]
MFRALLTVSGVFAVALGLLLLIAPDAYLAVYVDVSDGMGFGARRLSPAIIGLGVVLLLVAPMPPGPFPSRFAAATAFVWLGVAATGIYDFLTGTAHANILLAAVTEVILGALFLWAARAHR